MTSNHCLFYPNWGKKGCSQRDLTSRSARVANFTYSSVKHPHKYSTGKHSTRYKLSGLAPSRTFPIHFTTLLHSKILMAFSNLYQPLSGHWPLIPPIYQYARLWIISTHQATHRLLLATASFNTLFATVSFNALNWPSNLQLPPRGGYPDYSGRYKAVVVLVLRQLENLISFLNVRPSNHAFGKVDSNGF